jgi:hypothetical protein
VGRMADPPLLRSGMRKIHSRVNRRAINRWVGRGAPNPSRIWRNAPAGGRPIKRIARIGDCSWQEIDHAHTLGLPGLANALSARLQTDGVALEYSDYYAGTSSAVTEAGLARFVPEDADVVLIHISVQHAVREILPLMRWDLGGVRLRANHEAGRVGRWLHRHVMRRALCVLGRPAIAHVDPLVAAADMRRLLTWLHQHRPDTRVLVLSPHPLHYDGWANGRALEEVWTNYRNAAISQGIEVLDYRPRLKAASADALSEFVGANGYDLRRPGHDLLAAEIVRALGWTRSDETAPTASPTQEREPTASS